MRCLAIFLIFLLLPLGVASNYSVEFTQIGDNLVVREKVDEKVSASYTDKEILEKTKEGYILLKKVSPPKDVDSLLIFVTLDKGLTLSEIGAYPLGYKLSTDGQKISLSWEFLNIKENESRAILVEIQSSKTINYLPVFLTALAIALIFLSYLFFQKRFKKELEDKHLLDEERKVISLLEKADRNELWQKKIQDLLGLSKAKTSRLIRNLESRNLIEKIPFGNTNKIVLK